MFASCSWLVSLSFSAIHHAYYAHIIDGVRLELAFGVWFLGGFGLLWSSELEIPQIRVDWLRPHCCIV